MNVNTNVNINGNSMLMAAQTRIHCGCALNSLRTVSLQRLTTLPLSIFLSLSFSPHPPSLPSSLSALLSYCSSFTRFLRTHLANDKQTNDHHGSRWLSWLPCWLRLWLHAAAPASQLHVVRLGYLCHVASAAGCASAGGRAMVACIAGLLD